MKVSKLLETRRANWQELEWACGRMETVGAPNLPPEGYIRFASLYRSTCADLALADSYQLPPNTVQYLHQLIGRAHNQLYRNKSADFSAWMHTLLFEVPQAVFRDRCVHVAFVLFWGIFFLSAYAAYRKDLFPQYAEQVMGRKMLDDLNTNFSQPLSGRNPNDNYAMAGFYIRHNTGIGLECFATGLLIVPGLVTLVFNSAVLGGAFGFMARPDMVSSGRNFFEFVRGHGPFELTAIALSAGAGLRLGMSLIVTGGLTRLHSLQKNAQEAMPIMASAGVLFIFAAMIEGFLSPSDLSLGFKNLAGFTASQISLGVKTAIMGLSTALLLFYFVVLGFPREALRATR
jgi:uncharacterized membrane protein SpoIIM required for sporulation